MGLKATIKDVAVAAGVSTATVGRVIHQRGYVAEETRVRVERALQQTAFRPNLVAQNLRVQRSRIIGHLVTNLVPNPFFPGVEAGVEEEAIERGYHVLLWNTLADPNRERDGVEMFLSRRVDAMIFTTPRDMRNVQTAKAAGCVVVQVERPVYVETNLVKVDNYVGAVEAVEHLIQLGHRRIGFVGRVGAPDLHRSNEVDHSRLRAYRDVLSRNDIVPEQSWVDTEASNYSLQDGYNYARRILAASQPVTAVLAACDILAAGLLQAIYAAGRRVPDDISVVGFDNTFAPFLTPPLSTVDLNVADVGRYAARIAIDQVESSLASQARFASQVIRSQLVVRASTGPAPAQRDGSVAHTRPS